MSKCIYMDMINSLELEKCMRGIISDIDQRLNVLEGRQQYSSPASYEGITPIEECAIEQLIDCGPECAIYTDVEKTVEIRRRLDEAAKPTARQRVALDVLTALMSHNFQQPYVMTDYQQAAWNLRMARKLMMQTGAATNDGIVMSLEAAAVVLEAAAKEETADESH